MENLNMRDFLNKVIKFDVVNDMEYVSWVMSEGLRYRPSVPHSHFYYAKENVRLGKYNFEKGDMFSINLEALGHSSAQWIRPMEMLPERFD